MPTYVPLTKDQAIAYIGLHAKDYNLDPAALLAVAEGEGLNHPVTSWLVPGEAARSFGPPSWFGGGAGAKYLAQVGGNADVAAQWAWSTAGLDAWMKEAAAGGPNGHPAGLTGLPAITAIVQGFERPSSIYVQGNITNAKNAYDRYQKLIAQALAADPTAGGTGGVVTDPPGGNAIVPNPPDTGGVGSSSGTSGSGSGSGASGGSQDVKLGNIGPVDVGIPSGLVLGLFGMGLLALGALLFIAGSKGPMRFSDAPLKTSNVPDMASWNRGFDAGIKSVRVRK